MKARLWRVEYRERFSSSSGMQPYRLDTDKTQYVATAGDSLHEVETALLRQSNQITVTIKTATYLGEVFVS